MMRHFAHFHGTKPTYKAGIVFIGALCLFILCATGAAALAGLLPQSESVAVTATAIPLVDLQTVLSRTIASP
ncbi:hypothetical protein [Burkholderia sp. WSM2230]|uniref:hypothetical protein n=1 Tax=Burkholderia sp. WSM2230 TaxID=944435 RepID=UPI0004085F9F|nr:hypothetical protein [Burkholderia sp. WSM2230]